MHSSTKKYGTARQAAGFTLFLAGLTLAAFVLFRETGWVTDLMPASGGAINQALVFVLGFVFLGCALCIVGKLEEVLTKLACWSWPRCARARFFHLFETFQSVSLRGLIRPPKSFN
jgi:hypothetical protein